MVKDTFDITHIIGFTYGIIASEIITKFLNTVAKQITEPVLTRGVNRALGRNKKIKFCKTTININEVIVSFIHLIMVLALIALLIKIGIKPRGKLFA